MNLGFGKNYVINLKRHEHRRNRTLELLGHDNTIIIDAIDGKDYVNDEAFIKEHLAPVVIDPNGWWTIGIICCALSHRKAWKAFLDSGEETACFFEDDIVQSESFSYETIEEIRDGVEDKDWGCIFLGKYGKIIALVDDREYKPLHGNSKWGAYKRFKPDQWAAHAYILNRKGAQWLYDHQLPVSKATDVYIEHLPFNIYAPRANQFEQVRWVKKLKPDFIPFIDIVEEDVEDMVSHTAGDGIWSQRSYLLGHTLPKPEIELKHFKLPKFNASFTGYKFTYNT
tara:strand:+ start:213 stop:1061 length:849 start_codon:yes stop_codon:yes gene_type:complete